MLFDRKLSVFLFVFAWCLSVALAPVAVPVAGAQRVAGGPGAEGAPPGLAPDDPFASWLILGPVPVFEGEPDPDDQETQRTAFDTEYLTDHTFSSLEEGQVQVIGGKEYPWQRVEAKTDEVDFQEYYGDEDFVMGYAWAEFEVPEATSALLAIGSDDAVKVWLNGALIHDNWIARPLTKDEDLLQATFQQGKNQILLKVQEMQGAWEFSCRVLDDALFPEKLISYARRGDMDALTLLLSHGADVNAQTGSGLTALHAARISGREEAAQLLLEKGANAEVEMPPRAALVEALFEQVNEEDAPGAAVLIAQNGEILYQQGFGFASLEHRVPVTPETKFRIGSITKQFTAAAILALKEEGLLALEDPLSKFLPDFPRGDEVTIHHLLTHTSGIHSYTNKPDFLETVTMEVEPEELIETIQNDTFDFDPGAAWNYNNSGYFLLGHIIEKVSGTSYPEYLQERFFDPLGMHDTGFHHWSAVLQHEATGYSYEGGEYKKALDWDMSRAGGAGALYSTLGDLYRWNEAVFGGKALNEESLKAAFTPVTLKDGSNPTPFGGGYGYGWIISDSRGLKEISHGGGLHGFVTNLARYPEQNMTVAVLTNCAPGPAHLDPGSATSNIAQVYLWDQMEAQESFTTATGMEADLLEDYVGRYEYPGGAILTVTRDGTRLFAQLTGQPNFEIFPSSETEFFWKVVDAQITFVRNEKGEVTHAIHRQGGQEFEAPKIEEEAPADVDPALYDAYVGAYDFGNGAVLDVTREGDGLFVQLTGQPRFEVFPRSETEFFLKVVSAQITFVKDDTGAVTSLMLHQGGIDQTATRVER